MKTLLDPACYQRMLTRFRELSPDAAGRWGRMTAPQMLAHPCDQMCYEAWPSIRATPGCCG